MFVGPPTSPGKIVQSWYDRPAFRATEALTRYLRMVAVGPGVGCALNVYQPSHRPRSCLPRTRPATRSPAEPVCTRVIGRSPRTMRAEPRPVAQNRTGGKPGRGK